MIQESGPHLQEEIEEHFRNICESCSPIFDKADDVQNNGSSSPKFAAAADDLLCDLGNVSLDEGPRMTPVKTKLKKKPIPHYLRGTKASKAMQRPKSPMLAKTNVKLARKNTSPLSRLAAGKPV